MIDLRLKYEGGGRYQAAGKLDFDLSESEFEAGEMVRAKVMRPRSVRANNFLHALIEAAHSTQHAGPKFHDWHDLKDYLLVTVGHCNEERHHVGKLTQRDLNLFAQAISLTRRATEGYIGYAYDPKDQTLVARTARSTAKLSQEEFSDLTDRVVALICTEIVPGAAPEDILNEARSRTGRERKVAA